VILACGAVMSAVMAPAEIRLPAVFGSCMVLQQDTVVPVWGWGEPGEKVTVSLSGKEVSGAAAADGRWRVGVPVPPADGQPLDLIVEGRNRIVLTNVLAGEVWLCSGQSNMKMGLAGTQNGKQAAAAADFPQMRLFQVEMWCAPRPLDDLRGQWTPCSPATAGRFSAVGYFFGRDLHRALRVPVGVIDSTSGGTAAEAWTSRPALEADPVLETLVKPDPEFFKLLDDYADFVKAREERRDPMPPQPKYPFRGWGYPASCFYNAMIAPLVPFTIKGAAWYQGEARTGRFLQYERELTALISDWRGRWALGDFPFLVVQLPRITPPWNWPLTREVQSKVAAEVPNVGLVVTVDIPDTDLHPRIKEPVGHRLALAAQGIAYGRNLVYSGPVFASMEIEDGGIRLRFHHVGGGLVSEGGGPLRGFAVAGDDRTFFPADAVIDGDTVVVSSPEVPEPVAARYAFEDDPACNLFNREGLPASPFRTDGWPFEIRK
jgi:sialate O-acetylesterase